MKIFGHFCIVINDIIVYYFIIQTIKTLKNIFD